MDYYKGEKVKIIGHKEDGTGINLDYKLGDIAYVWAIVNSNTYLQLCLERDNVNTYIGMFKLENVVSTGSYYNETNSKENIMDDVNLIEDFSNIGMSENEQKFRKTGIKIKDGFLSADGAKVFIAWLLKQNEDKFIKDVVDPILNKGKKQKKG